MPKRKKWRLYPMRAVALPDGTVRAECNKCFGTGRASFQYASSNSSGMSSRYCREACGTCDGKGYADVVEVIPLLQWETRSAKGLPSIQTLLKKAGNE